ncbi:MAG: class I SAM-dependent methyltransferase [Acidobacteriia bacterium]|nr:class I SAM-dependent methyltransferase [Terriglobia bacterium]
MATESRPRTGTENGRLWGTRSEDWARFQEGQVRGVYETVMTRCAVGPGTEYLDAGCGAGLAVQMAAERGALVSGFDAAAGMLAVARSRVPHGDFRQAELEEPPYDAHTFDVVTGFNSFQFAANPTAALAQAKRVAKPGGTVVVMTWSTPDGMEAAAIVRALRPLLPAEPHQPGPFSLSDEMALRAFAADAGLQVTEVADVDCPWAYADLETALRALSSAGPSLRAAELFGQEAVHEAHRQALAPFRLPDGSYRIGARFRCLFTRA